MSERVGRALLKARFEKAGYAIQEDVRYSHGGVTFSMDGFDAKAGVGYEYVTTEAGDRTEITPAVIAHLESRMKKGEIAVLLLDELEAHSAEVLGFAADHFLKAVPSLLKKPAPKKRPAAKKKPAVKKKPVKKKAAKK